MAYLRRFRFKRLPKNNQGIALFMVMASISVLALLVTEFTYIAQVAQLIAFGGLDQTKAHYLAKTGLKVGLMRLKAYQQVKGYIKQMGSSTGGTIPGLKPGMIEKIWSLPFFYPIPTNIPGLSLGDRQNIEKFMKNSNLEGKLSINIVSESSKYNINTIVPGFAPSPNPSANPSANPSPSPSTSQNPSTPAPAPSYNPQTARQSLFDFFSQTVTNKSVNDSDFAANFRDFRPDEFVDSIAAWSDRTYERRGSSSHDSIPMKKAPFYSISELHMLPGIDGKGLDEDVYNLFADSLTASPTQGININSIQGPMIRALIPQITQEEVDELIKFRDTDTGENTFRSPDDFFEYLKRVVGAFRGNQNAIDQLKADLVKRNITLTVEESLFKVIVRAEVNTAVKQLEAWVLLSPPNTSKVPGVPVTPTPTPTPSGTGGAGTPTGAAETGLKIIFMRIS